jgi:hypothetical protein
MMLTAVRRLCGHAAMGPSGVMLQSCALIRSPISPPPARESIGDAVSLAGIVITSEPRLKAEAALLAAILFRPRTAGGTYDLAGVAVTAGRDRDVDKGRQVERWRGGDRKSVSHRNESENSLLYGPTM